MKKPIESRPSIKITDLRALLVRAHSEVDRCWQHREGLEATQDLLGRLPGFFDVMEKTYEAYIALNARNGSVTRGFKNKIARRKGTR